MMEIVAAVSLENEPFPELQKVELEQPRAGEVLVKVVSTGICHTDLHFHGTFGSMFATKPMVLGHEGAGIVEAVGTGVSDLTPGDHVVLAASGCGQCPSCVAGRPGYCVDMLKYCWSGSRPDGTSAISNRGERISGSFFGQSSFATHALVAERTAIRVAKDLPLHLLGPLCCGFITGAASVIEAFRIRPGQSIAIFGTGGVGFAAVMAARLAGAAQIVAVDIRQDRLDLALELGATEAILFDAGVVDALRQLRPAGFDFTFITAQPTEVFEAATACLAIEGTAGFVVEPKGSWVPQMLPLLTRGCKVQGIIGGGANPRTFIPMLIEYWRQGRFPFDRLITEFRFDQIGDAWEQFSDGKVIKPLLRM